MRPDGQQRWFRTRIGQTTVVEAQAGGDISLCYVQPESFRRGVGRALMQDLEGWLQVRGVLHADLNSTRTGRAFYRRLGYRESAPPVEYQGVQTLPMHKSLAASA